MNNIKTQSKRLLEDHRNGKLSTWQFLYRLNRLITVKAVQPNVFHRLEGNEYLIETTDEKLIPAIVYQSDARIIAKERDENGFICKVRAIADKETVDFLRGQ